MYADRRDYLAGRPSGIDPRSLGIAVALNGAVVAALLLAQPDILRPGPKPPLSIELIPLRPPPEPLPPPPEHPRQTPHQPISAPRLLPDQPVPQPSPVVITLTPPPTPTGSGTPAATPTATATPVLPTIAPEIDPAHRGDLQPVYPASELRAEHEGVVTVRVLVGMDGHVHRVERVNATSDAFFAATEERALAHWRFRPATRGGVPVEGWRTMTIRFVIPR